MACTTINSHKGLTCSRGQLRQEPELHAHRPRHACSASLQWATTPFDVPCGTTHCRKTLLTFGSGLANPPLPLCSSPACFGRIACGVKPYSSSLPLLPSTRSVPPESVRQETPRLGQNWCATQRHCLGMAASLPAFRRFGAGDVHTLPYSPPASSTANHGFVPVALRCFRTAPCPKAGAVTGLSYQRPPVSRGADASRFPLGALRCHQRLSSHPVRQTLRSFDTSRCLVLSKFHP